MTRKKTSTFTLFLLFAGVLVTIFPFYWMIATSLKTASEALQFPPSFYPHALAWDNYKEAWEAAPFGMYFFNSIFCGIISTIGVLFTSALAAYAFSRMKFVGKGLFFYLVLGTMMIPGQVLLIPNYIILEKTEALNAIYRFFLTDNMYDWLIDQKLWNFIKFGLNSYFALIFPWLASVFSIFLLRQFFKGIPKDLYDAAEIDGASKFRALFQIVIPLSKPALITSALLSFLGQWNSLLWPLIVTTSDYMRTLMVGLQTFQQEAGQDFHLLMAASSISILPILILFFFLQKYFVRGIVRSGMKS